jgi:multiple sugar transport system permease protein
LYEAGEIDGIHNRFQELFYITIPMMKPQLLFSAIMQIAAAFSVSTISMQLCGFPSKKYAAHTLVLHIMDYGTIRYEMGYACAIAVVLFIMMLVFRRGINLLMRFIGDE